MCTDGAPLAQRIRRGRRWVSTESVRSFVGTCVSLTLAMPYARFYTRVLYCDMSRARRIPFCSAQAPSIIRSWTPRKYPGQNPPRNGHRCRLSYQSLRDLKVWKKLTGTDLEGRPIRPPIREAVTHSDAADAGYGGTMGPPVYLEIEVFGRHKGCGVGTKELKAYRTGS